MRRRWMILVEAAKSAVARAIDENEVERLLRAVDPRPGAAALHCADRYALQVEAEGSTADDALRSALSRWAAAVCRLRLPAWELVRAEVLTPEEFERDLQQIDGQGPAVTASPANRTEPGTDDIGDELLRRVFCDPLTGALSEEALTHRLEHALLAPTPLGRAAVLRIDLDAFRRVNDRFGEAVGDAVLMEVARRLTALLRPGDAVARLAADRFAIVLENATTFMATAVADRILDALARPIALDGHPLLLTARAGIALSEPLETADDLLHHAGAALMEAKQSGQRLWLRHRPEASELGPADRDEPARRLDDRLAHLLLMQEAAVASNEADTLNQAAQIVMRQVCTHIDCAVGHLWLSPSAPTPAHWSAHQWHLAHAGDYEAFRQASEAQPIEAGVGLQGRVIATGKPVCMTDLGNDLGVLRREAAESAGLRSAFAFPLLAGREIVAVFEFFTRQHLEATSGFVDVLSGIGTQLGRVVERQRAAAAVRRSEERLRESAARLREAQSLARFGSWYFDLRTGDGHMSDELRALYGFDAEGGSPDLEEALSIVHPADRERTRAALARLVETGERVSEEFRIVHPEHGVRWHRSEGSGVTDDHGVVMAIHGTSQDITERRLVEDALRDRERQLAEAQRAARVGSWERDLITERVTWSEEFAHLLGWEPGSDESFEAFLASLEAHDGERMVGLADRLRTTGEPFTIDFRATVGGAQRWFRGGASLLRDEDGRPVKMLGTMQDITEQKLGEEALLATQEQYRRIVELAHDGIVTLDANDIVTFANPRFAQILGYSPDEMLGMPAGIFADEPTTESREAYRRRRRAGVSEHYETRLRTRTGAIVHARVSATPFFDGDQRYTGMLAVMSDITALRRAEEEVQRASLTLDSIPADDLAHDRPDPS
ncbi:MAG: PAS domain S-box protein [Acidimicrobiales bacterium]